VARIVEYLGGKVSQKLTQKCTHLSMYQDLGLALANEMAMATPLRILAWTLFANRYDCIVCGSVGPATRVVC
jgi:hypothetical protein